MHVSLCVTAAWHGGRSSYAHKVLPVSKLRLNSWTDTVDPSDAAAPAAPPGF